MVAGINVIPVAWIIDNSYHSTTVFIAEVYINPLNLKGSYLKIMKLICKK